MKIQQDLESFHPMLVVNQVVTGSKLNTLKLKKLVSKYLGIYLPELGEIPVDSAVTDALQAYMPVCEYSPNAKASTAMMEIQTKLSKVIDLFSK